jgi:hypothetical protein
MKKLTSCFLAFFLLLTLLIPAAAAENHDAHIGGLDNDTWFTKYGNVNTDCEAAYFLGELGYDWGDLVTVRFLDQELVLPVVPDYSYVESGESAVIVRRDDNGQPERTVSLAVNMGNFAETYGLGSKITDDDGNWHWEACEGITFPITVSFSLQEKEGYMAQYLLHELNRTNAREDYSHLSDTEFANFRELLPGRLYRTSSPINPELGRNLFADAALEAAGVTVIMNLADSPEEVIPFRPVDVVEIPRQGDALHLIVPTHQNFRFHKVALQITPVSHDLQRMNLRILHIVKMGMGRHVTRLPTIQRIQEIGRRAQLQITSFNQIADGIIRHPAGDPA